MNRVIRHIEYLTARHDCVVIPTMGAFIAGYRSARYDEKTGIFHPSSRSISFNADIDHNDGLLTTSIARQLNISFNRASAIVNDGIAAMRRTLESEGEVSLGRVGRFIQQADSSILFEPSAFQRRYESMGLQPMHVERLTAKPAKAPAKRQAAITPVATKVAAKVPAKAALPVRRRRISIAALKVAAAVAIVSAIGFTLAAPTIFNRHDSLASVSNPGLFTSRSSQTALLPGDNGDLSLNILMPAEDKDLAVVNAATTATVETATATPKQIKPVAEATIKPVAIATEAVKAPKYCLVIASLPTNEAADRYIAENGSEGLNILASDGKYRIYIAAAPTQAELEPVRCNAEIASKYPDAWICRMK